MPVFKSKAVGAFKASDGTSIYALFERRQVDPALKQGRHINTWRFYLMGTIEDILRTLFWMAANAEVNSHSAIEKPDDYIEQWLELLANPHHLSNKKLALFVSESDRSPIPRHRLSRVVERLHEIEQEQVAERLEGGHRVQLSLYHDWQIIEAVFDGALQAKQCVFGINFNPQINLLAPQLGYQPATSEQLKNKTPKLFKIKSSTTYILAQDEEGYWRSEGNAKGFIASFIDDYWQTELLEPGLFRVRLAALRSAVKNARTLQPEDIKMAISLGMVELLEDQETFNKVTKGLSATQNGDELVFSLPSNPTQRQHLLDSMNLYSRYILASGIESPH